MWIHRKKLFRLHSHFQHSKMILYQWYLLQKQLSTTIEIENTMAVLKQRESWFKKKCTNMLSGPLLIKIIISISSWNSILVCVCAFKCVFVLATFVVLNYSAAGRRHCYISDFLSDVVQCLSLPLETGKTCKFWHWEGWEVTFCCFFHSLFWNKR